MLASMKHTNEYNRNNYRPSPRFDYKNVQKVEPYFLDDSIYKAVSKVTNGVVNVAKDFWWDMKNDKLGYSVILIVGTAAGILGGLGAGPLPMVAGGLFGLGFSSTIHYAERRFIWDYDYKRKKELWRKKEEFKRKQEAEKAKKAHSNIQSKRTINA